MPQIVAISDTHMKHRELDVPDGDILIHAGDFTSKGKLEDLIDFNLWLGDLPHLYKVVIAGNHDFCFQNNSSESLKILSNAIYLKDQFIELLGLKIYGSPWQPWFFDWAFNLKRGEEIKAKWDLIPEKMDILITHGPPMGVLDKTTTGKMVGCEELIKKILVVRPRVHIFGHIHESYGMLNKENISFINASSCNRGYQASNKPIVINL